MSNETDCAPWDAYEIFKASLPPYLTTEEYQQAIREYCNREGI